MMTSEDVAKRIIKVIENKKRFSIIGFRNKLSMFFNKFITYFTAIKTCRLNFKKGD